ncbi:Cell division protein DivIC (FtsB), stabilizes FtsL against RasP cleavage [hydrothermal vent metagenome]|uniref:Cell division protein DivIC (FtsB), stabilizes FtsL against RasP cleavage n=1 Tax=hydrothermal vent metagenome TaxID=652676 RepID=A0A3B0YVK2_9ZZZZ
MKWVIIFLVLMFAVMQYKLWVGEGSLIEVQRLNKAIGIQQTEFQNLKARNEKLEAEVRDLKTGLAAVEERARAELGMIKKGETFYQVYDREQPPEKSLEKTE